MLQILMEDEDLIVVHKPPGMLVHRTGMAPDRRVLLQVLRDQVGQRLYPVHRLDRATAGLVILARSPEMARALTEMFAQRGTITKTYLAIVRGWCPEQGRIEEPLTRFRDGREDTEEAVTTFTRLATAEIPVPIDRYATARYSLVCMEPVTGRYRQLRRHFRHLRYPILGDRKLGDRHHNRYWREEAGIPGMMLLAREIKFPHPRTGAQVRVNTQPEAGMLAVMQRLGWTLPD